MKTETSVNVLSQDGELLYTARASDTPEQAIEAARRRGVQLPDHVQVVKGKQAHFFRKIKDHYERVLATS